MSRVFLARELALGRVVVLKVLPVDMASGVSAERFAREIHLAASLSQANIVPLLATLATRTAPEAGSPRGRSERAAVLDGDASVGRAGDSDRLDDARRRRSRADAAGTRRSARRARAP
jgi:serine/threonine-protein kinase